MGLSAAIVLLSAIGMRVYPGRRLMGPIGVLWVMWLTLGYFTARPVFPSLALFALLTLVADRVRLRWAIPLIFWVWASVHGGFIVGIGYLVLQTLRLRDRRYALDALAGCVAASFTAHGWGVWGILASFAGSSSNLQLISEWRAPDFISLPLFPFLLGLVALIVMGAYGKLVKRDLWIVVPFVVFAFTANRAVPLAAIAIAPFVFPKNEFPLGLRELARPAAWAAGAVILFIGVVVPINHEVFAQTFPVEAAKHLEDVPTFHTDGTGGYLIYAGFDEVFVDDRAELFGPLYRRFVEAMSAHPGWEDLFQEYDLRQALLPNNNSLLSVLIAEGWTVRYKDDNFTLLEAPAPL